MFNLTQKKKFSLAYISLIIAKNGIFGTFFLGYLTILMFWENLDNEFDFSTTKFVSI